MFGWVLPGLRIVAAGAFMLSGLASAQAAGALAVGVCGAYGYAYDYADAATARRVAQQQCSGDCKVVSMRHACAALAVDWRNACGAYGYAVASRLGEAQNTALKHCYKYGGRDCVIRAWACDGRGG